jgi:hypothetical protein
MERFMQASPEMAKCGLKGSEAILFEVETSVPGVTRDVGMVASRAEKSPIPSSILFSQFLHLVPPSIFARRLAMLLGWDLPAHGQLTNFGRRLFGNTSCPSTAPEYMTE